MRVSSKGLCSGLQRRQDGVALAILVWFLAAMSILVAGIVYQARTDIKLAQLHKGQAEAAAAGDGAINLAMAELMILELRGEFSGRGIRHIETYVGDLRLGVELVPVSGLIDLNLALPGLLEILFAGDPFLDKQQRQDLVQNVVEWRSSVGDLDANEATGENRAGAGSTRRGRFEAVEDLLLVPGVGRDMFDRISHSIYVGNEGQSGVDWLSAPVSVLTLLNSGDQGAAIEIARSRDLEDRGRNSLPARMNKSFQEVNAMPLYRIDALLAVDGVVYRRRRWVDRGTEGADGLPWSFFRTEAVTVINRKEREMLGLIENTYAEN